MIKGLITKVLSMFAVFWAGKSAGKNKERAKVAKSQLKDVIRANEIADDIRRRGADAAREQLRERARKRM